MIAGIEIRIRDRSHDCPNSNQLSCQDILMVAVHSILVHRYHFRQDTEICCGNGELNITIGK